MFSAFSLPILLGIFIAGAVAVWLAGTSLSNSTDTLSDRFHFGEALGGIIFLAIATNLPEIAITVSAALTHHLPLAIGNILGGIGIQTVVLVLLDIFGMGNEDPFTYRAASLTLLLEAVLVIAVLVVAIMTTQLPSSFIIWRVTPGSLLIVILWVVGIWFLSKAHKDLPWQDKGRAPNRDDILSGSNPGKPSERQQKREEKAQEKEKKNKQRSTAHVIFIFIVGSIVTLIAGVMLEESGNAIADKVGLTGVLFGATVLAAATSLPELTTGLASIRIRAYELAMSDIFGGNAFLPVLFIVADVISGQATLAQAQNSDIYLASLGMLLTTVYIYGIIFRPRVQILRMGVDSLVVLLLYIVGIGGLVAIALIQKK